MAEIKLTKRDLRNNFLRINLFPMSTINYERFQSLQYAFAMIPLMKKLYPDDKEARIAMAQRHMEFYNTTPEMINFTMGINAAQEEQIANTEEGPERDAMVASVNAVKTSLMGPLAGVGDSMGATIHAILGSISAGIAGNGSILGALLYFIGFNLYRFGLSYFAYKTSYINGTKAITDFNKSGLLDRVMESATILGLTSLGALIPNWIGFNLDKVFNINGVEINFQTELDNIFPGLVPLVLTLILARFYKNRVSALTLVMIVFVLAFVFSVVLKFGQ